MSLKLNPVTGDALSRPGSGILTPSSEHCVGSRSSSASFRKGKRMIDDHTPLQPTRKRLRTQDLEPGVRKSSPKAHPLEELLKPTISVTPHPRNLMVRPRTLQPLMLLRRENIPLSHLDLAAPSGEFATSRFVESHIKPLDLEGRLGSGPVALVAVSESTRKVYVFELHQTGIYTVCKLGSWVELKPLGASAMACCQQAFKAFMARPADNSQPFVLPHTTLQDYRQGKEKQRAIEELKAVTKKSSRRQLSVSLDQKTALGEKPGTSDGLKQERPDSRGAPPTTTTLESQLSGSILPVETQKPTTTDVLSHPPKDTIAKLSAADIFENIRTHYTETLYHSKGSVAYFAKGPLSRARAAFHMDLDGDLDMDDLIEFLKTLIMTTVQIDKKYREKLPEAMSAMKTLVESTDDETSKPKRKRSKKMKIGKDGLYPYEDEHVRKWWRSIKEARKSQLSEDEAITPEEVRFHTDNLRTRETLLQVITSLEILALEPLRANKSVDIQGLPGEEPKDRAPESARKKRNKHNLPLLLDVHADRLCIWQSTGMEVPGLMGDTQYSGLGAITGRPGIGAPDPLRDFCIDVIVPFFSSRLQQQSDTLSKKLGGPPVIVSPLKPKARVTPAKLAAKPQPRPGAATKRPVPKHGYNTNILERALSRDRARRSLSRGVGGADPLAALRAATLPVVPKLKREGSSGLASVRDVPRASPSVQEHIQANMKGVTIFEDAKARKKALVEAELRNAISAIKKPNRELAGKAIVEETEKRTLSQMLKGRKQTHSQQQVQVKATPANFRYKDVLKGEGQSISKLELPGIHIDKDCIPSSSIIPSSAPRRGYGNLFSSATKVAATPLKRSSTTFNDLLPAFKEDAIPASSPLMARTQPSTNETSGRIVVPGSVPGGRNGGENSTIPRTPLKATSNAIFETPMRYRTPTVNPGRAAITTPVVATPTIFAATPIATGNTQTMPPLGTGTNLQAGKNMSIFEKLGWDDNDDLI